LSEKREGMALLRVVSSQKSILCCGDFGSTIGLELRSSTEIKASPTFF